MKFPLSQEFNIVEEARRIFDTYADDVQICPLTGEVDIRNAVRINEDSPYKDAMLSEDDFVELEKKFGLLTHLRNDDSNTGTSNINYICEYKLDNKQNKTDIQSLKDYFLQEKKRDEQFYENLNKHNECEVQETETSRNRFLDGIDELK